MNLLHREGVIEAGYDLPEPALRNIAEAELEELKFGGVGFVRERDRGERWTRAEIPLHGGFGRGGHYQEKRSGK